MRRCVLFSIAALSLLLFFSEESAAAVPATVKTGIPTSIQANSMEYDAEKQTVIFLGEVHVARSDFELWAKKLTVYLKKKPANTSATSAIGMQAGDMDRLVAEGVVRLKSENRFGECAKATYFADIDKVVMEGSPVLRNAEATIQGSVITHFIDENRTHVGGGIVNATFQAPDRTKVQDIIHGGTP